MALDLVPQYQRTTATTYLSYFFPVWIVIGYVGYGLLAGLSAEERKKQTRDELRFFNLILHDREPSEEELQGKRHPGEAFNLGLDGSGQVPKQGEERITVGKDEH
jgi:hypothetical protein